MKITVFLLQILRQRVAIFFVCMLLSLVFFVAIFSTYLLSPEVVYAQQVDTFGLADTGASIDLVGGDIRVIVARIIRAALGLLGIVALFIVLYGGFIIMTSGGAPDKVEQGKKILTNGAIGLGIILSAFTITQFVLTRLQDAILGAGGGVGNEDIIGPGEFGFNSFGGSGSLGKIVQMHYPERDQTEVPRNTSIAITFNEAIDPSTLIENTNKTCWGKDNAPVICSEQDTEPYFGDCIKAENGIIGNPLKDCDNFITSVIEINSKDDPGTKVKGTASLVYDDEKSVYSFVFDPVDPSLLGDSKQAIWYKVNLTSAIKKKPAKGVELGKGDDAFVGVPNYNWEFQTGLTADFDPPVVVEPPYPDGKTPIARNTIIQIFFNEAINPLTAQGVFKNNGAFFNAILSNTKAEGEWKLTNGYKTLEFVSAEECGTNSCGEKLYCLPIVCAVGQACNSTDYKVLLRTAELKDPAKIDSFDAKPLTGIHDMASNALDGNADGKANPRPEIVEKYKIDVAEQKSDNYWWNFTIEDKIDLTAPYITNISPALDAENVAPKLPVEITFSHTMQTFSMNNGVNIIESPIANGVEGLWVSKKISQNNGKTKLIINHRDFGPNGQDLFYFITTNSNVHAGNGNCMYPGLGPYSTKVGESPTCSYDEKTKKSTGCVDVELNKDKDTGCAVPSVAKTGVLQKDLQSCINFLQEKVPKKPVVPPTL